MMHTLADKSPLPVVGRVHLRHKRLYFTTTPGTDGDRLVREVDALLAIAAARRELSALRDRPVTSTSTTTATELEVSQIVYLEISGKLRAAGYEHAIQPDGAVDMTGLRLTCGAPAGAPSPECDPTDPCAGCRCKFARGGSR